MNHRIIAFTLASALGLTLVGEVVAEPSKPPPAPVAGKVTLGVTVTETEFVATGWRISKLLSAEVRNDRDEKIGKIDDIIVTADGTLSVAIIEVGGFIGLGAHRVAVPVRQLVLSPTAPKVVLPGASKDALKGLPEFIYTS
jgi:PRC-barrel domain protein